MINFRNVMKPLPKTHLNELVALFSTAVFFVYSWTTYVFLWELRSHLMRFSMAEIAGFLSYQYAYSLIESVLITLVAYALVFVTPIKQIRARFAAAGSAYLFSLAVSSLFYMKIMNVTAWIIKTFAADGLKAFRASIIIWICLTFGLLWLSTYLASKERIRNALRDFLENLYVLSGLYVVLSIFAFIVVIYRNLP